MGHLCLQTMALVMPGTRGSLTSLTPMHLPQTMFPSLLLPVAKLIPDKDPQSMSNSSPQLLLFISSTQQGATPSSSTLFQPRSMAIMASNNNMPRWRCSNHLSSTLTTTHCQPESMALMETTIPTACLHSLRGAMQTTRWMELLHLLFPPPPIPALSTVQREPDISSLLTTEGWTPWPRSKRTPTECMRVPMAPYLKTTRFMAQSALAAAVYPVSPQRPPGP